MKRFLSIAGLLALVLSLTFGFNGVTHAYAQDPASPAGTDCATNADTTQKVIVGMATNEGDPVTGIIVAREVKGNTVNVYATCLGDGQTLTATKTLNLWSGYPNLPYAENDACRQAQADLDSAGVEGSWNAGFDVTYDDAQVPTHCGTDTEIRSVQKDEVVPAGTVALVEEVDFGTKTIVVWAETLDEDTTAIFTEGYRLELWIGYDSLETAQADVCGQANREAATAALDNGWNADFTVTINDGQPLSGCPTS